MRFAQSRALGRKVSDEFTVPVCRTHQPSACHCSHEISSGPTAATPGRLTVIVPGRVAVDQLAFALAPAQLAPLAYLGTEHLAKPDATKAIAALGFPHRLDTELPFCAPSCRPRKTRWWSWWKANRCI